MTSCEVGGITAVLKVRAQSPGEGRPMPKGPAITKGIGMGLSTGPARLYPFHYRKGKTKTGCF